MGVERQVKKRPRVTKVRAAVLGSIKAAGIITFGVLLPQITGTFISVLESRSEEKVRNVLSRLKEKGLVSIDADGKIRLTRKGERLLESYRSPVRPKSWDGRWRVVMFDIPERKRPSRVRLKQALTEIGFYRLQDSVWIHPFDCEEIVSLLKADFHLGVEVQYMVAESIENDRHLRGHFSLPQ